MKANQSKQTMKKKISQTVYEYFEKNPVHRTQQYIQYLNSKQSKILVEGTVLESCTFCHLIFPDNSQVVLMEENTVNDDDRQITIVRGCGYEDKKFFNEKSYTDEELCNVN